MRIAIGGFQHESHSFAPLPTGWQEFIHLAFWEGDALDAVLSLRLPETHTHLSAAEQSRLTELYILLEAGLQGPNTARDLTGTPWPPPLRDFRG